MSWELLYNKLVTERVALVGERHHIVPRSLGGSDEPSNIVVLSHRDHTLAHYIRYRWLGNYQDRVAYKMMSGQLENPMYDVDVYTKFVERMQSEEIRAIHSKSATKYWSNPKNRELQSNRRKFWIIKNNVDGRTLTSHLNTPDLIEKNRNNLKNWANDNPSLHRSAIEKAHSKLRENNKHRDTDTLIDIYSRGSGIDNPNWGGYIVITNDIDTLIYNDWNDAKNAPVGNRTLRKCISQNIPIWFGEYKGYRVYKTKELV